MDYRAGKAPASVTYQYAVAKHYGCALSDAEKVLADRMLACEAWETYMGDAIHPNPRDMSFTGRC